MDELSLYILDITMNSVRAGANDIEITLNEDGKIFTFTVRDNGCGMTAEQVSRLTDPFFTTRTTRKVGLGVPFLTMLAEMTGGSVEVSSTPKASGNRHGTVITASFGMDHIDFIPLGDIIATVTTLIQGAPEVNFSFIHKLPGGEVTLDCRELRAILGDDILLSEPEILSWISENLREQYDDIKAGL